MIKKKDYEDAGIATELIVWQMKRARFWFCAFAIAATAFIISCIR